MASIERRNGSYRVVFRYAGQKISRSLRTQNETAALVSLARLEDNLRRLELGTLQLPPGADVASFLLSDGWLATKPNASPIRKLSQLADEYLASFPASSEEKCTLDLTRTHIKHLERIIGPSRRLSDISFAVVQQYVDQRAREKGIRGHHVRPATIRKEIVTLTSLWRWGKQMGYVSEPLHKRGLRYPKSMEKPPFQTWTEIEHKIRRGRVAETDQAELWSCLFMTVPEIEELLEHVESVAEHPFIFPMVAFAAHTGARRSEIMRSNVDDIDLAEGTVVIHEKKRVRGKLSTRRVPLSPRLSVILEAWLTKHPGGSYTFCANGEMCRSRNKQHGPRPLSRDQAHDHLRRTLAGSKWHVIRGWHVFRHSFCSNCAAAGIDQRVINAWVGHQTEEMVKRYRHLIPDQQQRAIAQVFATDSK